jgi:DMSO/TMAO reductase YedYZ molybdopterin-dependent catalytic subunit
VKKYSLLTGGVLGGLSALVVVAVNSIASQLVGLPRPEYIMFDWVSRNLPGNLLTFAIDTMVKVITSLNLGQTSTVAKMGELTIAVLQFVVLGIIFGVVLALLGRRYPNRLGTVGLVGGLLISLPAIIIMPGLGVPPAGLFPSVLWIALVHLVWGWSLGSLIQFIGQPESEAPGDLSRQQFLWLVGIGSFAVVVSAAGLSLLERGSTETAGTQPGGTQNMNEEAVANAATTSGEAQSPTQSQLNARIQPAPGTRPELTSNDNFYRIDINASPPVVNGDTWRLEVKGLVDNPLMLSLDEIKAMPSISQAITLECISNPLGGDLTSSTRFTGVRLKDVLAQAGLQASVQEISIQAVDGFYESVPLSEAMDDRTLLVYAMNGLPLPVGHGFPLRIYIPNHFGMKQPKWIVSMEAIDHQGEGYWVDRGWSEEAIPPTTSVIDTVAVNDRDPQSGAVPVGGIAYSGARGISKVEVQIDNGDWVPAELRDPPLSPLTWVQWRYSWPAQPGQHTIQVRAYDGSGTLQETESNPPHPNGATGIYSVREDISSA